MFWRKNSDNDMAESEALEHRITGTYLDNQTKQFILDQLNEQQRQNNLSAYAAEQQRYAQAAQSLDAERLSRAAQVRANGGRWISIGGNRYIDAEGNIVYASDLR